MRHWLIAATILCGCRRETSVEARRDPTSPAPAPSPSAPPIITSRVTGDIEGRFTLASADVAAGEPIVVEFELRPLKGDLPIFVGGDMRNRANYPMRFSVRARDATGATVCDLVDKPELMNFGGSGGERVIASGETLRERFVLNPACGALSTPGTYRVALHRRVTTLSMVVKTPTPTLCDRVPIHEDSVVAAPCAKLLADAPSVTSDLTVVVRPFDRTAVRAAITARLHEAPGDEILRHRMERFVCAWVTCKCPLSPVAAGDLAAAVGTAIAPCP